MAAMWWTITWINVFWKTYGGDETQQAVQALPGTITSPTYLWEATLDATLTPPTVLSSPLICNLSNSQAGNEVVVKLTTLFQGKIYALRGTDGNQLWSYTYNLNTDQSPISCGDLDGDGLDEVVTRTENGVVALDDNGSVMWTNTDPIYSFSGPVIAEVDALSSGPEVLVTGPSGSNAELYVISSTGSTLRSITISITSLPEQPAGTPAVGDLDNDGQKEVVVTTFFSGLRSVDPVGGSIEWTVMGMAINQTPAVVDADGDGNLDVVYAYGGRYINVVRGTDGSDIWASPFDVESHTTLADTHAVLMEHFAVWDTDGDGLVNVFFGDGGDTSNANSHIIGVEDGSSVWFHGVSDWSYDGGGALADIDDDGDWDFLKTDDAGVLWALEANTGNVLWSVNYDDFGSSGTLDPAIAIGDVDGDGCSEVVVLGAESGILTSNYVVRVIDQSGGGGSGCTPLGREDEGLKVSERGDLPRNLINWTGGKPYAAADVDVYSRDGRLVGRFSKGERIDLSRGTYFVVSHGRVDVIFVR